MASGFEIEVVPREAEPWAAGHERVTADALRSLEQLGEALAETGNRFWAALSSKEVQPAEVELTLSVQLEAEGNWVIVKGKATGTAEVRLKWLPREKAG